MHIPFACKHTLTANSVKSASQPSYARKQINEPEFALPLSCNGYLVL
ncbi:hypothetical protein [Commensalibacter melissae]|nr:hypothetical protein [Commensalibacter melissae]